MQKFTTGELYRAFSKVFPFITEDMIREAAECGVLPSERNPFKPNGWHFYTPDGVKHFVKNSPHIPEDKAKEVLDYLGINFNQLVLFSV